MSRYWRRMALGCFLAAWIGISWWQSGKALPPGMHVASALCPVAPADLAFVADITAADAYGHAVLSQGIFDEVLRVVGAARHFIVLDYARFGAQEAGTAPQRRVAVQLTDALLARRRELPQLQVLFITDPANEGYGAFSAPDLQLLRAAGVEVVPVDVDALRDSNLLYSGLWRLALRWWDGPRGPFGSATRRLNFKSDERKLVLADDGNGGLSAVVGSANPLDRQSAWSNVAARVHGGALEALLASELAVARFSGWQGNAAAFNAAAAPGGCSAAGGAAAPADEQAQQQLLTEGAIRTALLAHIEAAVSGDEIDIAAFHLADRDIVEALLNAARGGVSVRLILDPNEDATVQVGSGISGLPNQPLASELVARSGGAIRVRWYRTHGERFHSALTLVWSRGRLWMTLGSASLTRRALDDFNLEANLALELPRAAALAQQAGGYFNTLWSNKAAMGIEYTADYEGFANPSQADYWLCRLLEGLGAAAF